jgi:hypothetical protein
MRSILLLLLGVPIPFIILIGLFSHFSQSGGWMKPITLAGVALIVLGVMGLVYQGVGYTKRKDVLDVGPIHATKDTHQTTPSISADAPTIRAARRKRCRRAPGRVTSLLV